MSDPHPALPAHDQPGSLAPVDVNNPPQMQAQQLAEIRRLNEIPVIDFLNNTLNAVDKIDFEELLDIKRVMIKSHKYYDGKQYGHVDRNCVWHDAKVRPDDIAFVDNQYKYHVDTALMEITRAKISLDVEAADETDADLVEAAKVAKARINNHRRKLIKPHFVQTEGMNLLLKTVAIRYSFWLANAGRKENVSENSKQTVDPSVSAVVCAICKHPMEPETRCPYCGSYRTQTLEAPQLTGLVSRYRKVPIGEPRCYSVDPIQITIHLNSRTIAASPYLKWKQLVMRSVLEEAFIDRVIPSTGIKSIELQYQRNIERSMDGAGAGLDVWVGDSDVGTRIGGEQFELIECEQSWLEPHIYALYRPLEDQELFNGMVLLKGHSLVELFPNGMYICRVGNTILDLWPESKNDKWSSSVFGLRPGGFYGSGTTALHNDQDVINMIRSLAVANANANAVPREFVNLQYLEGNRITNDPNEVIQITNLPEGATIANNIYHQAQGQGLTAEVYGLSEDAKGAMQSKLGTFSVNSAQPDLKGAMDTATGISIIRDMSVGRMGPSMLLLTEMDVEQGYQFLEMEQRNPNMARYKVARARMTERPQGNLEYTMQGVRALLKADIRNDLIITPTPDSWMPVTRGQKISNLKEFVPFLQLPAEIQKLAAEAFSIPMDIGGWSAEQKEAARRLVAFATICEFLEKELPEEGKNQQAVICAQCDQPKDEALALNAPCPFCGSTEAETVYVAVELVLAQANMPVDMVMDQHEAFIDFYSDWMVSDEAVLASDLLRRTVNRRTRQHYQAKTEYVKWLNRMTLETEAPAAVANLVTTGAAREQEQVQGQRAQDAADLRQMQKLAVMEESGALPAAPDAMAGAGPEQQPTQQVEGPPA